jgi:hypothetical protein
MAKTSQVIHVSEIVNTGVNRRVSRMTWKGLESASTYATEFHNNIYFKITYTSHDSVLFMNLNNYL